MRAERRRARAGASRPQAGLAPVRAGPESPWLRSRAPAQAAALWPHPSPLLCQETTVMGVVWCQSHGDALPCSAHITAMETSEGRTWL